MSGNEHIPSERLSAYERWELAAFDEAERTARAMQEAEAAEKPLEKAAASNIAASEITQPPPTPAISDAEIQKIRAQAAEEGRQAGFAQGRHAGLAEGRAAGQKEVQAQVKRIEEIGNRWASELSRLETEIADDLLALAIDIARQVTRTALKHQPELVLPVVKDAMAALISQHGHPSIHLHPEDAELVRAHLEDQLAHTGWRIFEDATVERGGCQIESASTLVDASIRTRWREVLSTLGDQTEWLDDPNTP